MTWRTARLYGGDMGERLSGGGPLYMEKGRFVKMGFQAGKLAACLNLFYLYAYGGRWGSKN